MKNIDKVNSFLPENEVEGPDLPHLLQMVVVVEQN